MKYLLFPRKGQYNGHRDEKKLTKSDEIDKEKQTKNGKNKIPETKYDKIKYKTNKPTNRTGNF